MKNAFPQVGLKPTLSVSLFSAHHAIHLRHGGLGGQTENLLGFNRLQLNYWPCVKPNT